VFNAVLFPALMWIASMAVAYLAANRLVIVPIRSLRGAIRRFALGDRSFHVALPAGAPLELQQVASTFGKLEQIIGRNESGLAAIAEEKLLLLREVHHRIKNNLQMISSIINIQRRKSDDPDVRLVLGGLQDRVLSIALIDQSLYQNGNIWDVRADTLIQSITDRLISVNLEPGHQVDITIALEPTLLHADQIGPVSLLANEAVTNALKYVGKPDQGRAFVRISLANVAAQIEFEVVNSVAPDRPNPTPKLSSSNLGMPLIKAFSSQLGATCTSALDESRQEFRMRVVFTPSEPWPDQPNALNF
jgi:two-component sensor histidine kinase